MSFKATFDNDPFSATVLEDHFYADGGGNAVVVAGRALTWQLAEPVQPMSSWVAYLVNGETQTLLTLPEVMAPGDQIAIYQRGSARWRIQQRETEQVRVGDTLTTLGETGGIASLSPGDWLILTYLDSLWCATDITGNLEIF